MNEHGKTVYIITLPPCANGPESAKPPQIGSRPLVQNDYLLYRGPPRRLTAVGKYLSVLKCLIRACKGRKIGTSFERF